jgi:DNA mismatch repair protein MutS2
VQTRFGKGVVREVLNRDRLMVDVQGRALVVTASEISVVDPTRQRSRAPVASRRSKPTRPRREARTASAEVDLHGLTVEQALDRVDQALNEALLADLSELRFIHGRSGGRIRNALHRRLHETSAVRKFRVDPRNEGVTIVIL